MAGKKISNQDLAGNTEVFNSILQTGNGPSKKAAAAVEEVAEDPGVHLTMIVKESTRRNWKQFFIEHGLNTTQGIEIAVLHLMDDIEKGKYKLSKGGLSEVKSAEI